MLIVEGVLDMKFYTYLTYTGTTLMLIVLFICMWWYYSTKQFMLWVFPLMIVTPILVSIVIIVLVQVNGDLLGRHYDENGIGEVHTADYIIHQLPVLEFSTVFVLFYNTAKLHIKSFIDKLNVRNTHKIWHILYFFYMTFIASVPLSIYALIVEWNSVYPTGIPEIASWISVVILSGMLGAFLFLVLYLPDKFTVNKIK